MHIDIDRFALIESLVHTWDTRCKIVFFTIAVFCISMLKIIELSLLAFAFSVIITVVSKIPVKFILQRVMYPILFLLPLFIFLPLSSGGKILIDLNFFNIYYDGLYISFLIFLKAVSIITLIIMMLGTSTFYQSAMALKALKIPYKLINLMLFTYRYIFVYLEDLRKMRNSLILRGYKSRNWILSIISSANLVGSLLIRSYEQTDRMYNAMILRGFNSEIKYQYEFQIRKDDIIKSVLILLFYSSLLFYQIIIENNNGILIWVK
ncbi:MAG: cobalt ECF transporter T component CbiQ [Spirochaetota bacterium]|nr:cobalt ECF transporter T component CbiQ [Spirochaetota bacterium]